MSQGKEKEIAESTPKFPFVRTEDGVFQVYSNIVDAAWTLYDVTLRFAQIAPTYPGSNNRFESEESARITVAWPQAKVLAVMLTDLVRRFEQVNGEIKPLQLAPSPIDEQPK